MKSPALDSWYQSHSSFFASDDDFAPETPVREVEIPVVDTPPLSFRERVVEWLLKRDTVFGEWFLWMAAFVIAWRCVAQIDGKPVAPFTSSSILQTNSGLWFWALILVGVLTLLALAYGLATGNTYRIRSIVSLFASVVWSGVAVAAITSGVPAPVYAGYIIPCILSWFCSIVLMVRAERASYLKRLASPAPVLAVPLDPVHKRTPLSATAPTALDPHPLEEK